ncbi:MAG: tetraacyldisaccharide 4'-kinase [Desulfuromonadales bacterium]
MRPWRDLYRRLVGPFPLAGHERFIAALLAPVGWLYGCLAAVRVALYRCGLFTVYRAPVPVLSIGNLAIGGTGKTPAVDLVVKSIQARGYQVAVVSRGYGGRGAPGGVGIVGAGAGPLLSPEICGDEPYLLARRNPHAVVVVAPKRARGVRLAVEQLGAQVIVLDDGFQHLAVARDLDIVLLDGRRPLGNGRVLPAGLLRENPAALARGHFFILTRCGDETPPLPTLPGPVLRSRHRLDTTAIALDGEKIPLAGLAGQRGVAFAGIADPEGFFADLRRIGLDLRRTVSLADHAIYDPSTLAELEAAAREADFLITTEKDGVKLLDCKFPVPCYQVPMRLQVGEQEVLDRILLATIEGEAHEPFPRTP